MFYILIHILKSESIKYELTKHKNIKEVSPNQTLGQSIIILTEPPNGARCYKEWPPLDGLSHTQCMLHRHKKQ